MTIEQTRLASGTAKLVMAAVRPHARMRHAVCVVLCACMCSGLTGMVWLRLWSLHAGCLSLLRGQDNYSINDWGDKTTQRIISRSHISLVFKSLFPLGKVKI